MVSIVAISQDKWVGIWEGTLEVGVSLRLVLHINNEQGKYSVKMDSPDQQAYGFKADSVFIEGDSTCIQFKKLGIRYTGKIKNDSLMNGIFFQGKSIPLDLRKVQSISKLNRPQTPQAPFIYETEDVIFFNADKSIQFGATITYPSIPVGTNYIKAPTYPVAVLISGSGAQNRDEEIMEHKPFAVIADALTKKGFLVIRTDDRGVGKTTGNFSKATSLDFANDVMDITDYIKKYVHADSTHIFLIGHSEGGMIAPMVANRRKDIYGLISLAGISIPPSDVLLGQNMAILKSTGMNDTTLMAFKKLYKNLLKSFRNTTDTAVAYNSGIKILNQWKKNQSEKSLKDLDISTKKNQESFIKTLATTFTTPWFHYFLNYTPEYEIKKLRNVHVLALNGEEDLQVLKNENIPAFEKYFRKSKVKTYTLKSYHKLNHLFQHCKTCAIAEYNQIEETFSPEVLEDMAAWMLKVL